MGKLNIQLCPETGICSIIKADGTKVDLMPGEVSSLREASGKPESIREVIAGVDRGFATLLASEDIDQLASELK
jgi:hypothetical protein